MNANIQFSQSYDDASGIDCLVHVNGGQFVISFNMVRGEIRHQIVAGPTFVKKWARDSAVKAARNACDAFVATLPADYTARNVALYAAEAAA